MTEQWMPGNKEELLSVIEREWNLLINLADSLTDEQMTRLDSGGWTPKDNLAHVAEWVNALVGYHMDRKPVHEVLGTNEEVVKGWDLDVINPVLFDRNKDRSRSDIMAFSRSTYDMMRAKLEATPFDDLLKPRYTNDPENRPLLVWVMSYTAEHFQEHRETIMRGL